MDKQENINSECSPQLPNITDDSEDIDKVPSIVKSFRKNHFRNRMSNYKNLKLNSCPLPNLRKTKRMDKESSCIEDYTFFKKLGVGSYGEVRLGIHKETNEKVAIKICRGQTSMSMLNNEAEILQLLPHQYFPKYIDYRIDEANCRSFLIMEYIEGKTLDSFLEIDENLTEEKSIEIIKSLANAVGECHELGIVHRDIKPHNVMITSAGEVKLIDFNISKRVKSSDSKNTSVDKGTKFSAKFFTQICSPLFAAPELKSLDYYTESIDIWGIGIIFLAMLKGMDIFDDEDDELSENDERFTSIVNNNLDGVSDSVKSILTSILCVKPDERPSISELKSTLLTY